MRDEKKFGACPSSLTNPSSLSSGFCFRHDADKNGDDFIFFIPERFEFLFSFITVVYKQFQPVITFV